MTDEQNDTPKAWEKQPSDTRQSWSAFQMLLLHEKPRPSLRELATLSSHHHDTIQKWSAGKNWMDRIGAYDDHMLDVARMQTEKAIGETREAWKTWMVGTMEQVQEIVEQGLKYTKGARTRVGEIDGKDVVIAKSSPSDIRAMVGAVNDAEKLMRLVMGEPTDVTETRTKNTSYEKVLAKIRERQARERKRVGTHHDGID